jgi:DNA-directed RNA polymerase I, II, and III subunit RPABC3
MLQGVMLRRELIRNRKFFASFGGLLLYLEGPYKKMTSLKIENVYMLLKKS